jgi:hypothetical protein
MSIDAYLEAARATLEGTTVNFDQFCQKLAKFFGYDSHTKIQEEDITCLRFEDLEECGLPRGKARRVALIFRGQETETTPTPQKVVLDVSNDPEKHAMTISVVDCVDYYKPDDPKNCYGKRISEAVNHMRCMAFDVEGNFNTEMSKLLVQEILDGYPERDSITVNEVPGLPVFYVGTQPDRFAPENPAKPGTPLSRLHEIDWSSIPKDVQRLIYLAVKETKEARSSEEFDIFEKVEGKNFNQVAKRYPKAAQQYQIRSASETLPQLKIRIGGNKNSQKPNDPFNHVRS